MRIWWGGEPPPRDTQRQWSLSRLGLFKEQDGGHRGWNVKSKGGKDNVTIDTSWGDVMSFAVRSHLSVLSTE